MLDYRRTVSLRAFVCAGVSALALNVGCTAVGQESSIVQPGAPGAPARVLSAEEATRIADSNYSPEDVLFLQAMIPHHQQALEMAELVDDRTNRQEIIDVAGRIDDSQADEIAFMENWLRQRGEPAGAAHHNMHGAHGMMGMATPEQMAALAAAEGAAFDQLFLELMITHHEGALTMVDELLSQPGSAYDPLLFEFVNDVDNDQNAEIERMNALLASLSPDPRAGLAAGFRDAGEAISNMRLVAALPKPDGFFDPANPSGLPPIKEPLDGEEEAEEAADEESDDDEDNTQYGRRAPLMSFSNTDMAFSGDVLAAGNYHGFNLYRLGANGVPDLVSSVVCPGGQGDVSIVGNLLIMSVEQTRGRVDCGREGIREEVSDERFRGIRIFDISDLARPRQVGQVQTCRGSHTHSVVASDDRRIVVYNSGTARVRDEEELDGCIGEVMGDDRTVLFRIDVIEIPVANPAAARITSSPAVFADPETGRLAGLWRGGDHGDETQRTSRTDHCHDITVFPELDLAAGACSGNGIIFDISDPMQPKRIDEVVDKGFAYWHSATFNNDGTKVVFTDEWGGGGRARCRASDPMEWGANAIYAIEDRQLEFQSYYKLPAPQTDEENCVAHNGSALPVPGRDIFIQAWYQGGISLMDFTDAENPVEIAYFDRGPVNEDRLVMGGYWSAYWYGDRIYGTEIARGLDVFSLQPSEYLSANEIAAAGLADQDGVFNPQQQFAVEWPADPVIARAYIDQLERSNALPANQMAALSNALDEAASALDRGRRAGDVARQLETLAGEISSAGLSANDAGRVASLSRTLKDIAARLA